MLRTETVTGLNVEKHKVEQIPCCSDMLTSTIKVIEFAQSAFSAVSDTATSAIVVVQFTYKIPNALTCWPPILIIVR